MLYHYPSRQDAATLWYHDHAMGINRLNIYAGLLGLFIVRDDAEDRLGLPGGAYDIPLVMCDRLITPQGQLTYPVSANPQSPWIPDLFGNIILVNGMVLPHLDVQPRRYRFRVLNASNARLYHLSLSNGLGFQQIATDQGLLPAPVPLTDLVLAPAERADLVLDFSHSAGERIVLKNDVVNVMQFRVARGKVDDRSSVPATLRPVGRLDESAAVKTRTLTLNEYTDRSGETVLMLLNETYWHMPITETPVLNTVEVWNLVNLTDDAHPIHLHLVRFQILDRRPFDRFAYGTTKTLRYTRAAVPPVTISPDIPKVPRIRAPASASMPAHVSGGRTRCCPRPEGQRGTAPGIGTPSMRSSRTRASPRASTATTARAPWRCIASRTRSSSSLACSSGT